MEIQLQYSLGIVYFHNLCHISFNIKMTLEWLHVFHMLCQSRLPTLLDKSDRHVTMPEVPDVHVMCWRQTGC